MRYTRSLLPTCLAMVLCLLTTRGLGQTAATLPATQPTTQPAEQPVFRFGVIADPHIEKIETAENLRRFLLAMRDQKIDFLAVLGDIVSYMPDLLQQVGEDPWPQRAEGLHGPPAIRTTITARTPTGTDPHWGRRTTRSITRAGGSSCTTVSTRRRV